MESAETKWETTTTRYVAYIDIMGFKDLVAKSTHDEIYQMMKNVNDKKRFIEGIKWKGKNPGLVRSTNYSDSLILYSKDDSNEALQILSATVAGLTYNLFLDGVPFKGALAFGLMTLDTENSIFFGQPLIDAYLLQEEVYYYGILIHASVDKEVKIKGHKWPAFTAHHMSILKAGAARHMTIYPMYTRPIKDNQASLEGNVALIAAIKNLRLNTSGHLRKYIDNTEQYLKDIANSNERAYK